MNTITGFTKVFYKNYLVEYGRSITVSSGNTTASRMCDLDRSTRWQSSGSDDTTQESIVIQFDYAQTIDRICLLNFNWKEYTIKYDNSGWTNFTNVHSVKDDAAVTGISSTTNTSDSRYYEFDSVTTSQIQILIDKTIVANAQKYIYELYIGAEIGTFVLDISCSPNSFDFTPSIKKEMLLEKSNGGMIKIDRADKFRGELDLKQVYESTDLAIIYEMFDYGEVAFYPCGADTHYTTERGWRMVDFYHVIVSGDLDSNFNVGRDKSLGQDFKFKLMEL
jgi:hypothetical protein